MKLLASITLFLLTSVCTTVLASDSVVISFAQNSFNKVEVFSYLRDKVKTLPNWSPVDGEAPVTMNAAIKVASMDHPGSKVLEAHLASKRVTNKETVWFYMIIFNTSGSEEYDADHLGFSVVLMNREVLKGSIMDQREFENGLLSK